MSTWLTVVLSQFVKRSTASRVVLDFILVLSRAIIKFAAWLSQFLFLIPANIRWDADLPTAKFSLKHSRIVAKMNVFFGYVIITELLISATARSILCDSLCYS